MSEVIRSIYIDEEQIAVYVTTDERTVTVEMDNDPQCCEVFGFMEFQFDAKDFVGATLTGVSKIGTNEVNVGGDYGKTAFVEFQTDRGSFTVAVYNQHNGYYGHWVKLSESKVIEETMI